MVLAVSCQGKHSSQVVQQTFEIVDGPVVEIQITLSGNLSASDLRSAEQALITLIASSLGIDRRRVVIYVRSEARRKLLSVVVTVHIRPTSEEDTQTIHSNVQQTKWAEVIEQSNDFRELGVTVTGALVFVVQPDVDAAGVTLPDDSIGDAEDSQNSSSFKLEYYVLASLGLVCMLFIAVYVYRRRKRRSEARNVSKEAKIPTNISSAQENQNYFDNTFIRIRADSFQHEPRRDTEEDQGTEIETENAVAIVDDGCGVMREEVTETAPAASRDAQTILKNTSVVHVLASGDSVQDVQPGMLQKEESAPLLVERRLLQETATLPESVDAGIGVQTGGVMREWQRLEVLSTALLPIEKLKTEGAIGKLLVQLRPQGSSTWWKDRVVAPPGKADATSTLAEVRSVRHPAGLRLADEDRERDPTSHSHARAHVRRDDDTLADSDLDSAAGVHCAVSRGQSP
eukprot:1438017-Rhodomonas_salina.2